MHKFLWAFIKFFLLPARCTSLYHCNTASKNIAPDDELKSVKHVERLMINKDSL